MPRTAVVTGASRGLGAAFARVLADEGFHLALGARDTAEVGALAATLDTDTLVRHLDVTDLDSVRGLRDATVERFGRVDVVVANAGIGAFGTMVDFDPAVFDRLLAVNVRGLWATLAAFAADLGVAPTRGLAVVVSSDVSARVFPGGGPYVATKFAVRALARTFQQEHPDLRVCELRPGATATHFADNHPDRRGEGQLHADEVAEALRTVVRAPDDVRIEELVVRSAGQAPQY
jgi:3-oxoacyl-[acyl-carrier protein] reductase